MTQGPTNRVLATIGSGPAKPVLDEALPRMRAFAERHGYDLAIGQGVSHGRPPAWAKIPFMQRLQTRYDLVLWIDADALFVDVSDDQVSTSSWEEAMLSTPVQCIRKSFKMSPANVQNAE